MENYATIPYADYRKVLKDLETANYNLNKKIEIIAALEELIMTEGNKDMIIKMTLKLAEILK